MQRCGRGGQKWAARAGLEFLMELLMQTRWELCKYVLGDNILEKKNYLHKSKETMKAENFIDKVRVGVDIKLRGVKRN